MRREIPSKKSPTGRSNEEGGGAEEERGAEEEHLGSPPGWPCRGL